MTAQVIPLEQRRAPRKRAAASPLVTDAISARPLGHLCNLSSTGVLLIAPDRPRSEAVFQVRLPLGEGAASAIELGGYRIIAIAPEDAQTLVQWLQRA